MSPRAPSQTNSAPRQINRLVLTRTEDRPGWKSDFNVDSDIPPLGNRKPHKITSETAPPIMSKISPINSQMQANSLRHQIGH
jgi:hypothetical protein